MALLETQSGLAGQYGYANGAPILNASVARSLLGDEFAKPLDIERNDLGWGTNSRYMGKIYTGVGLYGVDGKRSEIERLLDIGDKAKQDFAQGKIIQAIDPETNQPYYLDVSQDPEGGVRNSIYRFADENTGGAENFNKWTDISNKLAGAARTLGIDTQGMTDRQLYDAINKIDNRVAVTGRTQFWDATQAGMGGQEGPQHATVVYTQQDGKLVPVAPPQTFEFQDPKTSGNVFFQLVREGLMIPPIMAALGAYAFGPGGLLSGGEAAGSGLIPGAGGVTGLTPGAAGVTGITAPAGFTLAPTIGATVGAATPSLLDTAKSISNLAPPTTPTTPPVTPATAPISTATPIPAAELAYPAVEIAPSFTPTPGSFQSVLPELGVATQATTAPFTALPGTFTAAAPALLATTAAATPTLSPTDILRAGNALQQLTQQPQQQAPQTPEQVGQSGPTGVDYAGLLNLLAGQARITGLLGTRFQPTPVNLSSLLG